LLDARANMLLRKFSAARISVKVMLFIYLFIGERTFDNVNKAVTLQLDNKAQAWH